MQAAVFCEHCMFVF